MKYTSATFTAFILGSCLLCGGNTLTLAGAFGSGDYHGNTGSQAANLREQASQGFDTAGTVYGSTSGVYIPPVSEAVPVYNEEWEKQKREEEEKRIAEEKRRLEEEQRRLEQERREREERERREREEQQRRWDEQMRWEEQQRLEEQRRLDEQREYERQQQLRQEQERLERIEQQQRTCRGDYMQQSAAACQECCAAFGSTDWEYSDEYEPPCGCR